MVSNFVLSCDALLSFVSGVALFFAPDKLGDFVLQRNTDGVHWHLIRCVGGQMLAGGVFFYRFRNRPTETKTACYILRLMTCILCLFLFYNSRSVNAHLVHPLMLKALIYTCIASLSIYILLLFANGWRVGDTLYRENRVGNFLYQLDSIASIAIGMAWICDPKWLLHRQVSVPMDESHAFCGRLMGALFIASQQISGHALHWRRQSDRLMAAEARALCCLFILAAQVWSQIAYGEHWSGGHWVGICLFSTWTVIAITYRTVFYFTSVGESRDTKEE